MLKVRSDRRGQLCTAELLLWPCGIYVDWSAVLFAGVGVRGGGIPSRRQGRGDLLLRHPQKRFRGNTSPGQVMNSYRVLLIYAHYPFSFYFTGGSKLKGAVRVAIGPIATPDVIVFSELPKTRSGKIMRRVLRKVRV